jgi:HEAT repeat protein
MSASRRIRALRTIAVALCLLLGARAGFNQERAAGKRPEAAFQEAWYREMAEGRLEEALEAYRGLHAGAEHPRDLRARALLRSGICLGKLRRADESRRALEQVLAEFADVADVAQAARREIEGETEADASFRLKVESLISRLHEAGLEQRVETSRGSRLEKNAIVSSLEKVGAGAVPFLFAALVASLEAPERRELAKELLLKQTSRTVSPLMVGPPRVGGAPRAERTARTHFSEAAEATLRRLAASADPAVRAPAIEILGRTRVNEFLDLHLAALADPDAGVRRSALWALVTAEGGVTGRDPAPIFGLLDAADPPTAESAVHALARWTGDEDRAALFPDGERGARRIEALASVIRSPGLEAAARAKALEILGRSGRPEARPIAIEALASRDEEVLHAAVAALIVAGDRADAGELIEVLVRTGAETPYAVKVREVVWQTLKDKWASPAVTKALVERLPRLRPTYAFDVINSFDWLERRDLAVEALRHFEALDAGSRRRLISGVITLAGKEGSFPDGLRVVRLGLADPAVEVRRDAAQAAGALGDPALAPDLLAALADPVLAVRYNALTQLESFAGPGAVPALIPLLGESDEGLVQLAARVLNRIVDRSALERVLPLLAESADVPRPLDGAYRVVERLATAEDAPRLGAALEGMRSEVRVPVITLLGRLGGEAAIAPLRHEARQADASVRAAAIAALVAIRDPRSVPDAVAALDDRSSEVRRVAAEGLARFDAKLVLEQGDALEKLRGCLDDRDWSTRRTAVLAITHLRDARSVPVLIEALLEGDAKPVPSGLPAPSPAFTTARTRRPRPGGPPRRVAITAAAATSIAIEAARALLDFGDRRVVAPMLEALVAPPQDNPWLDEKLPLELLSRFAAKEDAAAIAAALGRVSATARTRLLDLLGGLGGADAVPEIVRHLHDEAVEVRSACIGALTRIGGDAALEGVQSALADSASSVRTDAVAALGAFRGPRSFRLLLDAFRAENDAEVLRAMVEALEAGADAEAIPALLESVRAHGHQIPRGKDRHGYLALWSLIHYPEAAAIDALASVFEGDYVTAAKQDALHVLARLQSARARELILSRVDGAERELRREAIAVLGALLDPAVLPKLVGLLKDPDDGVREAARKSIDEIRYFIAQQDFARGGAGGGAGPLGELVGMLASGDAGVRLAAVKSLARLRSREALPALVRLRKDPDAAVRAAVEEAMDAAAAER